ncbi:exodeoxyribonuclease VII small subunit [Xenorhabdus griffiniae]|uniref:Exodeoxyribonuclease 7 small subunit n=1 Tax=Xenorhabdus griffiniae TaxID=351672 RepID=A0ABY9XG44_9GAMM|nr:exodeoxyribonuclease VII small subunit [Xenorhabdus griffiniae]MBD1226970.1 exodeoxyribonuclease VII small subunit [Xenorhabdus griffiniae]MBE8586337.1 exodeoxyribonuclease VII small subunit [Xenorhabdus griffiniae]MDC9605110.1 exodeoxyribonuclease VII small subunit [Xenorhabdus griffiniae]WMV71802.1 exodeoxyribonuclease VII small subunit [Xenorhabdus griffiniae]WNH01479.1 exodeoxyribonuclease VII small subunit [Xenorhabdus griffiniae]
MPKANQTSATEQMPAFETSLKELEEIVIRLESGELPLEDALNEFERGIQLARQGQKTLQQAEQRVQILLNHDAQSPLDEFSSDAE